MVYIISEVKIFAVKKLTVPSLLVIGILAFLSVIVINLQSVSESNSIDINVNLDDNLLLAEENELTILSEIISDFVGADDCRNITYRYTISNLSNREIINLELQSDFDSFIGSDFSIIEINSTDLITDPSFNGTSNKSLLNSENSLSPFEVSTIELSISQCEGDDGVEYSNPVSVNGNLNPTEDDDNDDNQNPDENDDGNDDGYDSPTDWLSLTLYDANSDEFQFDITDGMTIDVSEFPGEEISLAIFTNSDTESGFITFDNGDEPIITNGFENTPGGMAYPFSNWTEDDIAPWDYPNGEVTIIIELYSGPNGTGELIMSETFIINFINSSNNDDGSVRDNDDLVITNPIRDEPINDDPIQIEPSENPHDDSSEVTIHSGANPAELASTGFTHKDNIIFASSIIGLIIVLNISAKNNRWYLARYHQSCYNLAFKLYKRDKKLYNCWYLPFSINLIERRSCASKYFWK